VAEHVKATQASFSDITEFLKYANDQAKVSTFRGMIKEHESDKSKILYAPLGCESWIEIEITSVKTITYLGTARCNKVGVEPHTHPVATLQIEMASTRSAGALDVVQQLRQRIATLRRTKRKLQKSARVTDGCLLEGDSCDPDDDQCCDGLDCTWMSEDYVCYESV
jgi:hypothetical protein